MIYFNKVNQIFTIFLYLLTLYQHKNTDKWAILFKFQKISKNYIYLKEYYLEYELSTTNTSTFTKQEHIIILKYYI